VAPWRSVFLLCTTRQHGIERRHRRAPNLRTPPRQPLAAASNLGRKRRSCQRCARAACRRTHSGPARAETGRASRRATLRQQGLRSPAATGVCRHRRVCHSAGAALPLDKLGARLASLGSRRPVTPTPAAAQDPVGVCPHQPSHGSFSGSPGVLLPSGPARTVLPARPNPAAGPGRAGRTAFAPVPCASAQPAIY
jgi:hypothetical protein